MTTPSGWRPRQITADPVNPPAPVDWADVGPGLLEACQSAEVLLDAFQGSLSDQISDTELASLHNSTAEMIINAIARAKGAGL